jgi:uncharacterized protein
MTITAYSASVPVFKHLLSVLNNILEKAQAFEAAKNINFATLPNMRLAPDMLPLSKQIQITSDIIKGGVARLAGVEPPKWDDNEATLSDLIARVQKTKDFIATFTPEQFVGCEEKEIHLKFGPKEFNFTGENYQLYFVIPNAYFHVTTAYNILRHAGVELGKRDFLTA